MLLANCGAVRVNRIKLFVLNINTFDCSAVFENRFSP
jgi:hypothetical protein